MYTTVLLLSCTTDKIKTLFTHVMYSEEGSTEREKEAATYMNFLDLLFVIEEGQHEGIY